MKWKSREGFGLIAFAVVVTFVVFVGAGAFYATNVAQRKQTVAVEDARKAIYLAERGLAYAYTELREHHLNWFTHKIAGNKNLHPVGLAQRPDIKVDGADWATNGDYLPFGDDSVRVRVYKDADDNIWAVAKATYNGVTRVIRASMVAGSLLEFFQFYTRWHSFPGYYKVDGKGFGKIYVNGSMRFDGRATFKNILLLSTNSTGHMYVRTDNKEAPYKWDVGSDSNVSHIDGWALLPMRNDEFYDGIKFNRDRYYGMKFEAPEEGEAYQSLYESRWAYDPVRYFEQRPKRCDAAPKFIFQQDVMGSAIDLHGQEEVTIYMPTKIYDESGNPVNYKFDIYKGKDADAIGEKPVKFLRFYKKIVEEDGSERWVITSDIDEADYAQVFDMQDTVAAGMNEVTVEYKEDGVWKKRTIPVKEDGITITSYEVKYEKVCDENGENCYNQISEVIPHQKTYDVEEEKAWWMAKYPSVFSTDENGNIVVTNPKIEDYIKNGFTRNDAEYHNFGYPEYDGFNALNTGYHEHALRFKDWLEGKYNSPKAQPEEVHDIDLTNIIKEGSTGAITLDPVDIGDTLSVQAKTGGIWIGYEKDEEGNEHLAIYINGEKKEEYDETNLPPWAKIEEFITGNSFWYYGWDENTKYKYAVKKANVLTLDVKKMAEAGVLNETNGVIWVDYRLSSDANLASPSDNSNRYNKAIKIVNAEKIPRDGGITIASPQSVMIQGDFNYQQNSENQDFQPCAIVTDGDIYVLSKDFVPPDYVPAFSNVVEPYRNALTYLKKKLGSDYWPNPDSDCVNLDEDACVAKLKEKLQKIEDALIDFYENQLPDDIRKYGAPARSQLEMLAESIDLNDRDPNQIRALLKSWFKIAHSPLDTAVVPVFDEDGNAIGTERVAVGYLENWGPGPIWTALNERLAPGMVMVKDDPDNRQVYINAAILSGEHRGDEIKYIENWWWFDPNSEYSNPAVLKIEGMFPHIMNKYNKKVPEDHWSPAYSSYNFSGSINPGDTPEYIAHDFSGNPPPGDFSYVGLSVYYIERDPAMFDKHPI